jgi:hypothetical protein
MLGRGCVGRPQYAPTVSAAAQCVPSNHCLNHFSPSPPLRNACPPITASITSLRLRRALSCTGGGGGGRGDTVIIGSRTFFPNGLAAPDRLNSVEHITIAAPPAGAGVRIFVNGTSVPRGPQPFALVVSGPIIAGNGANDCFGAPPCQHGGTCVDGDRAYACECAVGYTGTHCEAGKA